MVESEKLSLSERIIALAREYIRVSWSSFVINFVCLFVLVSKVVVFEDGGLFVLVCVLRFTIFV